METIFANVRYALRLLYKRKGFSVVVMLTLAIGIGASASVFSFISSILLQPLPFPEADRLVIVESVRGGEKGRVSQRDIADILEGTTVFEDVAGYIPDAQYNLTERGAPEEIPANICQQNLFSVLGGNFMKGAPWPKEFDLRRSFGIVISEELWKRKFNEDKNIVNASVVINPAAAVDGIFAGLAFNDAGANHRFIADMKQLHQKMHDALCPSMFFDRPLARSDYEKIYPLPPDAAQSIPTAAYGVLAGICFLTGILWYWGDRRIKRMLLI